TTLSNPVVRFLAWNMPYHTEHHIYPTVPFHHLPKLHRLLSPHLVNREHGYFRFHYRMITNFLR
ncbi:MAG: fatty acid desaturase, partial [Alphaproteobacteria bacterium]